VDGRRAGILLLLILALPAWGASWRLGGYWRTGVSFTRYGPDHTGGTGYSPLRLSVTGMHPSSPSLEAAYVLTPLVADSAGLADGSPPEFRIADLDRFLYGGGVDRSGCFAVRQNLDRLNIGFHVALTDIIAGRQAIYWGVSKAVSPTDFIAPWQFDEIYTEYRRGVDGVRLVLPVGALSEVDVAWLFGQDGQLSLDGSYARGRIYLAMTDITLLAAEFRENLMIGASLNRTVGGATAWLEGAWTRAGQFSDDSLDTEDFLALSAGADYSFGGTLYGFLEYHLNTAGSTSWEDYGELPGTEAYSTGGIYLLGVHYLCPGMTAQLSPLLSVSGSSLVNLFDPSACFVLGGEYSAAEDVLLESGFFLGAGAPDSEFGGYPDRGYASIVLYF
jgi:hypothetical protein